MIKSLSEIITQNLFFKLQEGEVDCDCSNFYCFKALDNDNFYFGYYHRAESGRWEVSDGAYDLSVTETTPAQLSIVDEFDLDECATKEEAAAKFMDYFATLYQRDFPTKRLGDCVENGEASLRQLSVFVGERIESLWAGESGRSLSARKDCALVEELPSEVLELLGCVDKDHFLTNYGQLEEAYLNRLVTTLKTLYDRKKIADDYIDKLLSER